MLSFVPAPIRGYLALAVAAIVLMAGIWAYNVIYDRGFQASAIQCQQEMAEMLAANERAMAAAEKTLREEAAQLQLEKDKLQKEVDKLDAEAAQDPDADNCGISARSVQRLNAVR